MFVDLVCSDMTTAAEDFERARALDPNNPALAINYRNIGDVECIVLVDAGREPVY